MCDIQVILQADRVNFKLAWKKKVYFKEEKKYKPSDQNTERPLEKKKGSYIIFHSPVQVRPTDI